MQLTSMLEWVFSCSTIKYKYIIGILFLAL